MMWSTILQWKSGTSFINYCAENINIVKNRLCLDVELHEKPTLAFCFRFVLILNSSARFLGYKSV